MTTRSSPMRAVALDAMAITLSFLCLLHCLALPLLAAFLPLAGALSELEWLHRAFVIAALPITLIAVWQSWRAREGLIFPALAIAGLSLLVMAAFVEALHDHEVTLTTMGGLLLAFAHGRRWIIARSKLGQGQA